MTWFVTVVMNVNISFTFLVIVLFFSSPLSSSLSLRKHRAHIAEGSQTHTHFMSEIQLFLQLDTGLLYCTSLCLPTTICV